MRVIFYKEHKSEDVFAYFPENRCDNVGNKLCYAHIGQHSGCSPRYAAKCKLAEPHEYQELKRELEQIGYELEIKNNLTSRRKNVRSQPWLEALAGIWLKEQPEVVQDTLKQYV